MNAVVQDTVVRLDVALGRGVPCQACTAPARWEFSMRCCGDYLFTCDKHHDALLTHLEGLVGRPAACGKCLFSFGVVDTLDAFARVVIL